MSNQKGSSGIGFLGLLTIVFITLKLLNKIDWSWLWVFSPLWLPALFIVTFVSVSFVVVQSVGFILSAVDWLVRVFKRET